MIDYNSIPSYKLRLSEAVDFLNSILGKDTYTNNIVKNYIKSGVLQKTEAGLRCCYTKEHLIQLIWISYMRPMFKEQEIREILNLVFSVLEKTNNKEQILKRIYQDINAMSINEVFQNNKLLNNTFSEFTESKDFNKTSIKKIKTFEVIILFIIQLNSNRKTIMDIIDKSDLTQLD